VHDRDRDELADDDLVEVREVGAEGREKAMPGFLEGAFGSNHY
jgi:hypothetical protein